MRKIRHEELGVLSVDCGDVVCFAMDDVIDIVQRAVGREVDLAEIKSFIKKHNGICCDFRSDGCYGVAKVTVIGSDGNEYSGALIGGPEGDKRLLMTDEESFDEWMDRTFSKGVDGFHQVRFDSPEYKSKFEEHRAALREG